MALSPDGQALLELILAKGQSYDDLASLLDVSEAEVRTRARAALTELGGEEPDRNVALTDWVLGQADPIGRADAARHVKEDPADHRLAGSLIAALRELAPDADYPKLPPEPGGGRLRRRPAAEEPRPARPGSPGADEAAPPPAQEASGPGRLSSLSSRQTRLIAGLGGAAVLVIAIVLGLTGAFGGGDEDSAASTTAGDTTTAANEDIQTVPLRASSGGDARGSAAFGIASGSQPFVDLDISNLEPAPAGEAYVLWLLLSEDQGHPLTPFEVNQDGTYSEQIPIASFLTELASKTQLVDVSLSPVKPLLKEVATAVDKGSPIIAYTGESILRGQVAPAGGQAQAAP